ncbi:DUF397 domain-containing protein [Streptomyces cellulosae]
MGPARVAIRDSKVPDGDTLSFPDSTFAAFVTGLKQGTAGA